MPSTTTYAMLQSYLKVALRTLRKQKAVSIVTIGSLAVGLACCLLLFLYVQHERAYDRFHENADRIFRVVSEQEAPDGQRSQRAFTPPGAGGLLEETFPEVEQVARFYPAGAVQVAVGNEVFEETVLLGDSTFFDVFDGFELIHGTKQNALKDPNSVVLSEAVAQRLFGDTSPIGRRMRVAFREETVEATVTGVVRTPATGTSIPVEVLMPFHNVRSEFPPGLWSMIGKNMPVARTYVVLAEEANATLVEQRVSEFLMEREKSSSMRTVGGDKEAGYYLQALRDVHLSPQIDGGLVPASSPTYAFVLAAIALLILLLACINFTTLSLGRSTGRARETGIRKAVGARREQVAVQFWGESLLTASLGLAAGVALARLALPVFNQLTATTLRMDFGANGALWGMLVALLAVVGFVAGGYPAWALSRLTPVAVLRGRGRGSAFQQSRFSHALVVAQFALSVALVTGAFVIQEQIQYATQHDLGFEADRVVAVGIEVERGIVRTEDETEPDEARTASLYERFHREAAQRPEIESVAGAFPGFASSAMSMNVELGDSATVRARQIALSEGFVSTTGMRLLAGRRWRPDEGSPDGFVPALVNETMLQAAGWTRPEAALGKRIVADGLVTASEDAHGIPVVGVVSNFRVASAHENASPYVLVPRSARFSTQGSILVRLGGEARTEAALSALEGVWKTVAPPEAAFEYAFLSDIVREKYEAEHRWRDIVRYGAGLALLISCAGLFGLALLNVQRRRKEIGIRKVVGASVWSVTGLVLRQFAWLVFAGFVLAVPLAWLGARRWLDTFAYRIELSAGPFLMAGLLVLAVAMATVGYQALRAARANPVEAIRQE